ncbi:MAG: type II toxin-antitoxin system RelE/ParE family toxin, partial [Tumebacillaceae bacterium]
YVERLKVKGTWNGLPFTKFLEDGIWELRPGNLRILFFVLNEKYVLLHFFFKTTNKTPRMELEHAKKERDDWLNRHFADHEN